MHERASPRQSLKRLPQPRELEATVLCSTARARLHSLIVAVHRLAAQPRGELRGCCRLCRWRCSVAALLLCWTCKREAEQQSAAPWLGLRGRQPAEWRHTQGEGSKQAKHKETAAAGTTPPPRSHAPEVVARGPAVAPARHEHEHEHEHEQPYSSQ